MQKISLVLLNVLLLCSAKVLAKTHYLAPNGKDTNTCGAYNSPCKSLKRALKTSNGNWRLGAKDQILLKGGRYVVNYPAYDQFYLDDFPLRAEDCLVPSSQNSLYLGIDPMSNTDVAIEMGDTFADPLQNPSKRGALLRLNQSSCIIVDGINAQGKKIIFDGKYRQFGLSNGFYDAFNGGPIPAISTPQPPSTGLIHVTDYSGKTAILPTDELIYGGIVLKNLEVRNTMGVGIGINKQRNITIANNYVHHIFFRAIGGYGFNVTIQENQVSHAAQINRFNMMFYARQNSGGWPGVVQMSGDYEYKDMHARSGQVFIRGNFVTNSWGEGIIANSLRGEVLDNVVVNAYSVGIYLEHATDILVERNYIYADDALYHRPLSATPYIPASSIPDPYRRAMDAVTLATESGEVNNTSSLISHIKIANNIMVGTRRGLTYWYDSSNTSLSNSYSDINFSHNVIAGSADDPIRIFTLGFGVERFSDNKIYNNLIEKNPSGYGIKLGDSDLWDVRGNYLFNYGSYKQAGLVGPSFSPGVDPHSFAVVPFGEAYLTRTVDLETTGVIEDWNHLSRAIQPTVGAFEISSLAR